MLFPDATVDSVVVDDQTWQKEVYVAGRVCMSLFPWELAKVTA